MDSNVRSSRAALVNVVRLVTVAQLAVTGDRFAVGVLNSPVFNNIEVGDRHRVIEQVDAAEMVAVYAAFAGIATAGTAIIGMAFFGESTNPGRVCSLVLIIVGLIGLKVFSGN
jgi:hypothetical protein